MRTMLRFLPRRQASKCPQISAKVLKLESVSSKLPGDWANALTDGYVDPLVSVSHPPMSGAFISTLLPAVTPL
jgi:hypothetical protein